MATEATLRGSSSGLSADNLVDTDTPFTPIFASPSAGTRDMGSLDPEMVELALLLPMAQAMALENAAHQCGLSTAQFLRRMIKHSLANLNVVR